MSDDQRKLIIRTIWQDHRRVLGTRKLWLRLRRDGHDIARCMVERLMRDLGIAGVVRGKRTRPVDRDLREPRIWLYKSELIHHVGPVAFEAGVVDCLEIVGRGRVRSAGVSNSTSRPIRRRPIQRCRECATFRSGTANRRGSLRS